MKEKDLPKRRKEFALSPIAYPGMKELEGQLENNCSVQFIRLLKDCFQSKDGAHQVALIKQIGQCFQKSVSATSYQIELCFRVLVTMYLQTECRHAIKRAIASTLQSLPLVHHPIVQRTFTQSLRDEISSTLRDRETDRCRQLVDNVMACHENFGLGAQSVAQTSLFVLEFLHFALDTYRNRLFTAPCPTDAAKASMDCLAAARALVSVLQRSPPLPSSIGDAGMELLRHLGDDLVQLMAHEENSLDCRCNSGIALTLLAQLNTDHSTVKMIAASVFLEQTLPVNTDDQFISLSPLTLQTLRSLTLISKLSLAMGFLSVLETPHLFMKVVPNQILLLDVIFYQIMSTTKQATDSSITIVTSRLILLWTKRAKEALESEKINDDGILKLRGDGQICCQILEYVWTHWEHFVDSVRHITRDIFNNVISLHLLSTQQDPNESEFVMWLAKNLLKMSWTRRGKYSAICCIVQHIGTHTMLQLQPSLIEDLLSAMHEQTLLSHAAELMETLFECHRLEVKSSVWEKTWVSPVINEISNKSNTSHLVHILSKLLKCSPSSLNFIVSELVSPESEIKVGHLRCLLVTAKTARSLGIVSSVKSDSHEKLLWDELFPVDVLKLALCHVDDEIRLDAFAVLCDCPKTTEVLTRRDLELIRAFLPYNMTNQAPSFRQRLVALIKKLLIRISDGSQTMRRHLDQLERKEPNSGEIHVLHRNLQNYQRFVKWLCVAGLESLYPGANFPRRGMALNILKLLHNIIGFDAKDQDLNLSCCLSPPFVQTLIECLRDNYETNKYVALQILRNFTTDQLGFNDLKRVSELFEAAMQLASRPRSTDCSTAAYLFQLLVCCPNTWQVAVSMKKAFEEGSSPMMSQEASVAADLGNPEAAPLAFEHLPDPTTLLNLTRTDVAFAVLEVLTFQLMVELEMARGSLLEASVNGPMYGVLFCVRSLLQELDFSKLNCDARWKSFFSTIIGICLDIGDVVSPIVNNASPEGHLPMSTNPEDVDNLHKIFGVSKSQCNENSVAENAAKTRAVSSQILLVCGWRTMKEVSLILGDISQRAIEFIGQSPLSSLPDVTPADDVEDAINTNDIKVLVSVNEILQIGDYFITLLAETKHRGAFEQAYVGFCKLCDGLWRTPRFSLQRLPQQWLLELFDHIQNGFDSSRLCSTRRSAGIPFMVQALVSSEPDFKGLSCFKHAMSNLLKMALSEESPEEVKVHAFNILRALYRDTRLGDDVTPFIADGLRAAILGINAKTWAVRNSSTLLFSSLVTRIFGVKRSKDELSKKNCMTGNVFFQRFPSLFTFLLTELDNVTTEMERGPIRTKIQPSLHSILLILARLYPSSIEGTQSGLRLSAFIPFVIKCGHSPAMKTRVLAAKALVPLVSLNDVIPVIRDLIQSLPDASKPRCQINQNAIHGTLLQISLLFNDVTNVSSSNFGKDELTDMAWEDLHQKLWIASRLNSCPVTRAAFLGIVECLVTIGYSKRGESFRLAIASMMDEELENPVWMPHTPGIDMLQTSIAKLSLELRVAECVKPTLPGGCTAEKHDPCAVRLLERCVTRLLFHLSYEVRWVALNFLYESLTPPPASLSGSSGSGYRRDSAEPVVCGTDVLPFDLEANLPCEGWRLARPADPVLVQLVLQSEELLMVLMTMATDTERQPDCLTLLYYLLPLIPHVFKMPWTSPALDRNLSSAAEKMELILQRGECEPRDDIRSALLHFSGCLIPDVYVELCEAKKNRRSQAQNMACSFTNPASVMREWTEAFLLCCAAEQSLRLRLTATHLLVRNGRVLLLDPSKCLGSSCLSVWSAAVLLLRDDEPAIKQLASSVVEICSNSSPLPENHTFNTTMQPALALDIFIGQFVSHFGLSNQSDCLTMLLDWILRQDVSVQDAALQFEDEEKMFEKGQVNIYAEEITFTNLVNKHFKNLLRTIFQIRESAVNRQGGGGGLKSNVLAEEDDAEDDDGDNSEEPSPHPHGGLPQSFTLDGVTFRALSENFRTIMESFKVTSTNRPCTFLGEAQTGGFDVDLDSGPEPAGHVNLGDVVDMVVDELSLVLQDVDEVSDWTPFLRRSYDQAVIRCYHLVTAAYSLCKYDDSQKHVLRSIHELMESKFGGGAPYSNVIVHSFTRDIEKLCSFHDN